MSDRSGDPWGISDVGDAPEPEAAPVAEKPSRRAPSVTGGGTVLDRMVDLFWRPIRLHTDRESLRWSGIVAAAVLLAYWFTRWPLPELLRTQPDLNFYVVQPIVWLAVTAVGLYGWARLEDQVPFSRIAVGIAFLVGVFHVSVLAIAGVIWDFGNSPIAGRLINYPKNLLYIGTLLAGAEVARAYLFWVWRRFNEQAAFVVVTLLLWAVFMPVAQWTPFEETDRMLRVVGGRWIPALALSALGTFLVGYGGLGTSFAYRFALLGFEWFSPILPDLDWPVLLVVGVSVPFASVALMRSIYGDTAEGAARHPVERDEAVDEAPTGWRWVGWAVSGLVVVLAFLFANGTFGYSMVVIEGISMEPSYERGDVAIVREKVDVDSLRVNDVILFREGRLPVVHRIIAIEEGPDGPVFTTKGDNVDRPDPPVTADAVEGKVVFLIPELGHVNLWIRGS
jgi:signal peptidase